MLQLVAATQNGSNSLSLLFPVLIIAAFYLLLIRPQRRRQRQLQTLQGSIEPGAQILTTSGMYATVRALDDDSVTLEVAPGVEIRFARAAIARVVTPSVTGSDSTGSDAGAGEPVPDPSGGELPPDGRTVS